MRSIPIISFFAAALCFMLSGSAVAQKTSKEVKSMVIKTSVVCEMCKEKIEKNLIFEKGVREVSVDMDKKEVTVNYRADKTNPEKIKTALSKLGYRADDLAADPEAFKNLPSCCKAEGCGKD